MDFNILLEDDAQQQATQQQGTTQQVNSADKEAKKQQLFQAKALCDKTKNDALASYNAIVNRENKKIEEINKQLTALGYEPAMTESVMTPSFSSILFESLNDMGGVEAMRDALGRVFTAANVSYVPDETRTKTYARKLVTMINKLGDGDEDRLEYVTVQFEDMLKSGNSSYSDNEVKRLCDAFRNEMANNDFFKWIDEK